MSGDALACTVKMRARLSCSRRTPTARVHASRTSNPPVSVGLYAPRASLCTLAVAYLCHFLSFCCTAKRKRRVQLKHLGRLACPFLWPYVLLVYGSCTARVLLICCASPAHVLVLYCSYICCWCTAGVLLYMSCFLSLSLLCILLLLFTCATSLTCVTLQSVACRVQL